MQHNDCVIMQVIAFLLVLRQRGRHALIRSLENICVISHSRTAEVVNVFIVCVNECRG